jgi:hypothetical protein
VSTSKRICRTQSNATASICGDFRVVVFNQQDW